jgi:hypothetical protein
METSCMLYENVIILKISIRQGKLPFQLLKRSILKRIFFKRIWTQKKSSCDFIKRDITNLNFMRDVLLLFIPNLKFVSRKNSCRLWAKRNCKMYLLLYFFINSTLGEVQRNRGSLLHISPTPRRLYWLRQLYHSYISERQVNRQIQR